MIGRRVFLGFDSTLMLLLQLTHRHGINNEFARLGLSQFGDMLRAIMLGGARVGMRLVRRRNSHLGG